MKNKAITGSKYIVFSICIFIVFLLIDNATQLLLGSIFGGTFIDWQYWVQVLSKIVPAILWFLLFFAARGISISKLNFDFAKSNSAITYKNIMIAIVFVIIAMVFNYTNWGGFKLIA